MAEKNLNDSAHNLSLSQENSKAIHRPIMPLLKLWRHGLFCSMHRMSHPWWFQELCWCRLRWALVEGEQCQTVRLFQAPASAWKELFLCGASLQPWPSSPFHRSFALWTATIFAARIVFSCAFICWRESGVEELVQKSLSDFALFCTPWSHRLEYHSFAPTLGSAQ